MRRSLAVLAIAPVLMATQCYPRYDVQVSPGPAPKQAVFTGVRDKEAVELGSVTVARCRPSLLHHVVWDVDIRETADSIPASDSLVYGAAPAGFFERKGPEPLVAGGCYTVSSWGRLRESGRRAMGSGGFHVLPDGTVANGLGARGGRLAGENQVERAAVGCRRDYRRAGTAADSTRVDARVWAVADTSITCGFLRTRHPEIIATTESTEWRLVQVAGGIAAIAALLVLEDRLNLQR